MISKELLSEILGDTIYELVKDEHNVYKTKIRWFANSNHKEHHAIEEINIYELTHKCKEWAFNNINKTITSEYNKHGFRHKKSWKIGIKFGNSSEYFIADTELEGIIQACEYILKWNKE